MHTAEVHNYWKLIEYAEFAKSRVSTPSTASCAEKKCYGKMQSSPTSKLESCIAPATNSAGAAIEPLVTASYQATISPAAGPQSQTAPVTNVAVSTNAPMVIASRKTLTQTNLGYFPSMIAHGAIAQAVLIQNDTELLRLQSTVKEYEAKIHDLSTRLVKAKLAETQSRSRPPPFSDRIDGSNKAEAHQQESELALVPYTGTSAAGQAEIQAATPICYNMNQRQALLAPTNPIMVPPFPLQGHLLMQQQRHEGALRQYYQQQDHRFMQQSQGGTYQQWLPHAVPKRPTRVAWRWGRFWEL